MKKIICIVFSTLLIFGSVGLAFADTDVPPPMKIGDRLDLKVPLYQQQKSYTCGPACIRMAIKKFGITATESAIASKAGTTSGSGTYAYKVAQTLNYYLGNKYAYYSTSGTKKFSEKLITSLRAGYPVICQVKPTVLPNYEGKNPPKGHYVIVKGFILQAGATTQISVNYNDPHYDDEIYGSFYTNITKMERAINDHSGYYIAH